MDKMEISASNLNKEGELERLGSALQITPNIGRYGQLVILKKTGEDSKIVFRLENKICSIGSDVFNHIQVKVEGVSKQQCVLYVDKNKGIRIRSVGEHETILDGLALKRSIIERVGNEGETESKIDLEEAGKNSIGKGGKGKKGRKRKGRAKSVPKVEEKVEICDAEVKNGMIIQVGSRKFRYESNPELERKEEKHGTEKNVPDISAMEKSINDRLYSSSRLHTQEMNLQEPVNGEERADCGMVKTRRGKSKSLPGNMKIEYGKEEIKRKRRRMVTRRGLKDTNVDIDMDMWVDGIEYGEIGSDTETSRRTLRNMGTKRELYRNSAEMFVERQIKQLLERPQEYFSVFVSDDVFKRAAIATSKKGKNKFIQQRAKDVEQNEMERIDMEVDKENKEKEMGEKNGVDDIRVQEGKNTPEPTRAKKRARRNSGLLTNTTPNSNDSTINTDGGDMEENVEEGEGNGKQQGVGSNKKNKRRKVRFGPPLSPELFDKKSPTITPVKRGAKAGSLVNSSSKALGNGAGILGDGNNMAVLKGILKKVSNVDSEGKPKPEKNNKSRDISRIQPRRSTRLALKQQQEEEKVKEAEKEQMGVEIGGEEKQKSEEGKGECDLEVQSLVHEKIDNPKERKDRGVEYNQKEENKLFNKNYTDSNNQKKANRDSITAGK